MRIDAALGRDDEPDAAAGAGYRRETGARALAVMSPGSAPTTAEPGNAPATNREPRDAQATNGAHLLSLNGAATRARPETPAEVGTSPAGLYGKPVPIPHARVIAGRIAGCASLVAGGQYLVWRLLSTVPGSGIAGVAFWIVEAINFVALALTVPLIWRTPGRPVAPGPPAHSLDVFVTVCGEPAAMVEETLRAALAIAYPHRTYVLNDGRIAGRADWREIERLAARLGVTCFTRATGPRGKAANLNHALARTSGELIATIDADHLAVPDFAHQTLGYFSDPRLAFLTTPQQYSAGDDQTLQNRELFFYRVIQPAKDAANSAFSCGNGIVYRRVALASIGGFSEWNTVEDVHTSYQLHANGWRSAYHNHAVTTGTAPPTFAELARQRLRWAADSVRLLLWDNPLAKRGLTPAQRAHYLHTTSFYLIAATQLVFVASPALYLLAGVSIMRVSSVQPLLWHSLVYYVTIALFFSCYCGPRETLRVVRQQLVLSPVYLLAVLRGLMFKPVPGSVTEKIKPPSVSWAVLCAGLLLIASLAALGSAVVDPGPGRGIAAAWAAWFAFALAGPAAAIGHSRRLRGSLRGIIYAGVLLGVLSVAVPALHRSLGRVLSNPTVRVREALLPPTHGVYLGVFNPAILSSQARIETWERRHSARVAIVNSYQQWLSGDTAFHPERASAVAAAGGVLMITWEPWAKPRNSVHSTDQPRVRLKLIAAGRFDGYIEQWARAAAAYRGPLLIRFMQEMNGTWYPWAYGENGNTARDFVAAWRHVHDIFQAAGATNVRWVWAINTFTGIHQGLPIERFYPGRRYVDWVSMTGFNWGAPQSSRTVHDVFGRTLRALTQLRKPIMISEVGTVAGWGNARAWIRSVLIDLPRRHPSVRAIVWFDDKYDHDDDFRLRGQAGTAFDAVVAGAPALRAAPMIRPVSS